MASNQRHAGVKVTNGPELVKAIRAQRDGQRDAVKLAAVIRKYATAETLPFILADLLQTYSRDEIFPVIKQAVSIIEAEFMGRE